jgi:hypothetical protein
MIFNFFTPLLVALSFVLKTFAIPKTPLLVLLTNNRNDGVTCIQQCVSPPWRKQPFKLENPSIGARV